MREFENIYLEEYCKVRNTRPDFKEETLKVIKNIVGEPAKLEACFALRWTKTSTTALCAACLDSYQASISCACRTRVSSESERQRAKGIAADL